MKTKFLLFPLVIIILISFVYAVDSDYIFKQNTNVDLKRPCIYNGTWCSSSAVCNLTIISPSNSLIIDNKIMTNKGSYHNYTLNTGNTNILGTYKADMVCLDAGFGGSETFYYEITPNGFNGLLGFYIIIIVLSYGLVMFGITKGDMPFTLLGDMGLYFVGLYLLFYGIDIYKNTLTDVLAWVTLGIAIYVSTRTGIEYVQEHLN